MNKEFLNPAGLPKWEQAFSQVVIVKGGATRTIYIAGQVAVDHNHNLIGDGDLLAQAEQAFSNLMTALAAAAATVEDVVKLNIYVKHYQPDYAPIISEVFRRWFPQPNLPTSTWLGVESLAEEGFLIEVDAIAVAE